MAQLSIEVKRLVYTVICFRCILLLTAGSAYERYVKLFSQLLTLCMCCGIIVSLAAQIEDSMLAADRIYDEWVSDWEGMTDLEEIEQGSEYYTDKLWSEKIIGSAYEQYEMEQGGAGDAGMDEEADGQE